MRQRIDLAKLYPDAVKLYPDAVEQLAEVDYDGVAPLAWPTTCPFTLDDLLTERRVVLEKRPGAAMEESYPACWAERI